MHKLLLRLKPGASKKIHLISASLLWSVIGTVLVVRGSLWLVEEQSGFYIVPAILIGSIKSLFILDKSARKSIDRILRLADGSCLGAVYSWKTWLVVLAMMLFGYILRHSSIPLVIIGSIYVAVGWALFFSSRVGWRTLVEK
ncbi:hypothetical protein [Desulfopila inferna]|uniref:hypothetical protein n=1 Tax=Desulfopila inferna TaxID=468528 RepID=UPI001963D839|nr:hypothetical protein [Desulfopila inferna]MBM9605837.1 hypothetical protein [Desulfopila inferna]